MFYNTTSTYQFASSKFAFLQLDQTGKIILLKLEVNLKHINHLK